jgi:hypothetical protein
MPSHPAFPGLGRLTTFGAAFVAFVASKPTAA